jgi:hypothetical protein
VLRHPHTTWGYSDKAVICENVTEGIALRQDLHVEVGTPFLKRTQGKLQERARAMIERRPELDRYFDT